MHPAITIASQPFPVLYFLCKERFNRSISIERRYPLDHLFLEDAYSQDQFEDFLKRDILDATTLDVFRERMRAYSTGLWTPQILGTLETLVSGNFFDLYAQLNDRIVELLRAENSCFVGGKEVLVEEYALPLANFGARVIFVIRDPRAMIASLNFRERDNLTGDHRPILYSLRAWRKSVALAVTGSSRGDAVIVRYEDFVLNQDETLKKLTDFLKVDPFRPGVFDSGIVDQFGNLWRGNSSFADQRGISRSSLAAFEHRLPSDVRSYIEFFCAPEMKLLSYRTEQTHPQTKDRLLNYRDPFGDVHPAFPPDYSHERDRLAAELQRLQLLRDGLEGPHARSRWFISAEAYSALKSVFP
jgi:hypothetical protein